MAPRIGRNIASARVLLGWDQADLAEAVSEILGKALTTRTLGKIEREEREAKARELQAIADALQVPVEWFYEGPAWIASARARGYFPLAA